MERREDSGSGDWRGDGGMERREENGVEKRVKRRGEEIGEEEMGGESGVELGEETRTEKREWSIEKRRLDCGVEKRGRVESDM